MLPIILITTIIFWILLVAKTSFLPWWTGEPLYFGMFCWALYFYYFWQRYRLNPMIFWLPPVISIYATGYAIYNKWILLPYILLGVLLLAIVIIRRKWVVRWKEGFLAYTGIFLIFITAEIIIRKILIGLGPELKYMSGFVISYLGGMIVWYYFVHYRDRGKIR